MGDYDKLIAAEGEFWDREFLNPADSSAQCFWHHCPWIQKHITQDLIRRTVRLAGPGKRALDLGCGNGWLTFFLADTGAIMEGADVARNCIEENQRKASIGKIENAAFYYFDANQDALPENQYDLIVCWGALHHVQNMDHLVGVVRRALKSDGRLVLFECVDLAGWRGKLAALLADLFHFLLPTDRSYLQKIKYMFAKLLHKRQEFDWSPFEMAGGGKWKERVLESFEVEFQMELIGFISPFIARIRLPALIQGAAVHFLYWMDRCLLNLKILKPEYYYMVLRGK